MSIIHVDATNELSQTKLHENGDELRQFTNLAVVKIFALGDLLHGSDQNPYSHQCCPAYLFQ